jgi:methionine synthase II (cobalamin-independent)
MTTRLRADHVGSLLRPAALLEARAAYASGQLGEVPCRLGPGPLYATLGQQE